MSGLQAQEDRINGVDVREQGSALRVATSTPHLVSLGTGRYSTAVTLHPIKQGRVTIGSDPTCDIYVPGGGVANVHCRVESSHGVVTLYPVSGSTLIDGEAVDKPTRLSQGSMLTVGRSNYLRFNHPEEAQLMKAVLPGGRPVPDAGYAKHHPEQRYQNHNQPIYNDCSLSQLDQELDLTIKEIAKKKPPAVPKKPQKDEYDSNSDHESQRPKMSSIMAKVSKFEYYAKSQQKASRSQFYTHENDISPKVFSSNSLTVNTPAKDVLGGRNVPTNFKRQDNQKVIILNENNALEARNCYANVAIKNRNRIDEIVRNFDDTFRLPKKINNDQQKADNIYGKINNDLKCANEKVQNDDCYRNVNMQGLSLTSLERREGYTPVYGNSSHGDWSDAENRRLLINNDLKCANEKVQNDDCYRNVNMQGLSLTTLERREGYTPVYGNSSHGDWSDAENMRLLINNDLKCANEKVQNDDCYRNVNFQGLSLTTLERREGYTPVYGNSSHGDSSDAEKRRLLAYQDRVKEEEQKDAENARLEEILNMCAEYEKQIASGSPITPTEKRSHNKIITNGSLPRSVTVTNPNFVQTSDGYYKFDTSRNRNNSVSRSLPMQRNLSSYENINITTLPQSPNERTPEVTITNRQNYENPGRMDEIGIPVFEDKRNELSSPIMIRKLQQNGDLKPNSPVGSPYENLYNRGIKPKSPNTQSPRTRIKTSFAHKNLPSPQYFIFPTPPPVDNSRKPNFTIPQIPEYDKIKSTKETKSEPTSPDSIKSKDEKVGIEKQLSLEEEIPMIDDSSLTDDIEYRYSKVLNETEAIPITKNKSFDDVKKELMADIPELDEFEKDLKNNREKIITNIQNDKKKMDEDTDSRESGLSINDNVKELRRTYEKLKEERRGLVSQIHEIKCKMSDIRSQEDDILRELEMEKALIKGEYDSEIAILNIEQKKKTELLDKARKIEEEIKSLKERQEARQNEMQNRVEIATMKVERIEKDLKHSAATMEELQYAQDILDNETKIFEDLEFQHLEEESELLSNREDLQTEITLLTKKIDAQKSRILTLKSEASNNLTSALDETKVLQAEYVKWLNKVEGLTTKVQAIEKELKPLVMKLNDIERTQSPDSAFFTDQTRAKSGEFGYSPQTSDSDEIDLTRLSENYTRELKDKFNSIDQMSQSMMVDIERRDINELVESSDRYSESPSKSSTSSKEKKGFWERNFDSLSRRKSKDKKQKSPEKVDIMSQSLNENMFYNNEIIEAEPTLDRFNSLRNSKKNKKETKGPLKSSSSSKIPTFAALGKIIKKDSFGKKSKDNETDDAKNNAKNRYVKNNKTTIDNKYYKNKSQSPEKIVEVTETEDAKDTTNLKGHNVTFDKPMEKELENCQLVKVLHRKSCGDEPNGEKRSDIKKISDSGKIPSQDDIDRISKVTLDAPILSSDTDMNSLGKRTVDSLMEIERNRLVMLEEQGCQMIENEREKISELKRRVQDETKRLWDQKCKREQSKSLDSDTCQSLEFDRDMTVPEGVNDSMSCQRIEGASFVDDSYVGSPCFFDDGSGIMSSIEELQIHNSRADSIEDEKRSDDSRPLSHASDNILSLSSAPRRSRRAIAPCGDTQRPLTRYLPVDRDDFDLRRHVESAGHQVELCPHVTITATTCRGYLHKLGAKFHTWSKRWFVFDRDSKTFVYYWDKSERKPRGGAYFQVIEEVYLDHGNTSKSPSPQTTFIVKTRQRRYYLTAPSGEAARMWIDVIFTGAQGYTEYLE